VTDSLYCRPAEEGRTALPSRLLSRRARRLSETRTARPTGGFTLIELLVAVTIMAVMTLAIARITSQTNDAIAANTRQAVENANARAALDMISRDLSQAIGDARVQFRWDRSAMQTYGGPPRGFECDEIRFGTYRRIMDTAGGPTEPREAVLVSYRVEPLAPGATVYSLRRHESGIAATPYTNVWASYAPSGDDPEVIRNVVEFRTECRNTNGTVFTSGTLVSRLPVYVDVYLALLTDSEARRATDLGSRFGAGSAQQNAFIVRNAKRYHTRCLSLNRTAYINGR
jgi:prepilin-type N-terminal cleavage/methylation domain-containing protein